MNTSIGTSSAFESCPMVSGERSAAFACIASSPPYSPTAVSTSAVTDASSAMSNCTDRARPPASRTSAATASALSPTRSPTTTAAPSAPRRRAVAAPMPDPPPATITTFSDSPRMRAPLSDRQHRSAVWHPLSMTSTERATKPLPPVEQVRPGLWSIPVPLPIPLRYVFVYAFETDKGPFLVDAGWNTDDAYDALSAGLGQAGFEMADVQGVMVTHIHPDHYGLAGRVQEMSDAWIALHPADAALVHDRYEEPTDLLERMGAMLRKLGAPASELEELKNASMPARPFVDVTP